MSSRAPSVQTVSAGETIFAALAGVWVALALLKFGNPIILEREIPTPANRDDLLIGPWPVAWGYLLFGLVAVSSARVWRWKTAVPGWLLSLPPMWLFWQCVASTQTVDKTLTLATLKHFAVCTGAFYLGIFGLSQVSRPGIFWMAVIGGFGVALLTGWRQHFGGLEETRRFLYSLPDWQSLPSDFLKKVSSNRIYGTLFYPNALAGAVLLFLPITLHQFWKATPNTRLKTVSCTLALILGLGCLYWSGSKAGWLIALVQGALALCMLKIPARIKYGVVALLLAGGLTGFWLKNQGYFGRGATSVSARFEYWRVAWQTLVDKPWVGSGPGTFMVQYRTLKSPDAEMTRLAHNDFLQQGSDSGWLGFVTFHGLFLGSLAFLYRRSFKPAAGILVGLTGITLQSFVEFNLYIPALAWPIFLLLGLLLASSVPRNQIDKTPVHS